MGNQFDKLRIFLYTRITTKIACKHSFLISAPSKSFILISYNSRNHVTNKHCVLRCTFLIISRSVLSEWEMFKTKVLEEIKTHILCSIIFFFENCAVYGIIWKTIVESDSPQMTSWHMRISYWTPNSANSDSENVLRIAFYCNNGCKNARQCYVIRKFPVLFLSSSCTATQLYLRLVEKC